MSKMKKNYYYFLISSFNKKRVLFNKFLWILKYFMKYSKILKKKKTSLTLHYEKQIFFFFFSLFLNIT